MKNLITPLIALVLGAGGGFLAGNQLSSGNGAANLDSVDAKATYGTYYTMTKNILNAEVAVSADVVLQAVKDATSGQDSAVPEIDIMDAQRVISQRISDKEGQELQAEIAKNKAAEKAFFEEKSKEDGVVILASGLGYKVLTPAEGPKPAATDVVTVNYEGKFLDGEVFDSSYERGEPASFPLNRVIAGWTEGVQLMSPGATYEFYVPGDKAYGDEGRPGAIPPASTLIFKVELLSIETEE